MLKPQLRKGFVLSCALFLLASVGAWGDARRTPGRKAVALPAPATVEQYIRNRFEVPETVKLNAQPWRPSPYPNFSQTIVTADDGKQKFNNEVFITNDRRCFVFGNMFALTGATNAEVIRCLRDAAKLPPTTQISVGPFSATAFPEFLRSSVTVKDGTKVQSGDLFVTRDRRSGILGMVLPFRRDVVEGMIDTRNQPSVGPAHARVTIVEYADLQCPGCAYFQKFLETEFLPKYGSKVRVIFKEYPLPSHDWSGVAAVANECAYQLDPSKFVNYRTLIFGSQSSITAANVREQLLSLGGQAGLDRARLGTCLDSKASQGRIEASRQEARNLGINKTPTFCVNGRIIVGIPSPTAFCKIVDEALADN